MNVVDYANKRLQSNFAVNKFMKDTVLWDDTVKALQALPVQDKFALQVAGRLDIAAYNIYKDAQLDWVLAVYNSYKNIGDFGTLYVKKSIHLTLTAQEEYVTEVPLSHDRLTVQNSSGELVATYYEPVGNYTYADVNGDASPDVRIYYKTTGALIKNVDPALTITFVIVYDEISEDNDLDVGTEVLYPSLVDIKNTLQQAKAETQKKYSGFAGL